MHSEAGWRYGGNRYNQKHIERKGDASDPSQRLKRRIASGEAVADMVKKHTDAGNDPQRKSRHIFSSPPFLNIISEAAAHFNPAWPLGKAGILHGKRQAVLCTTPYFVERARESLTLRCVTYNIIIGRIRNPIFSTETENIAWKSYLLRWS